MTTDNALGLPMFQPDLTGDQLPPTDQRDWIAFCEAVIAEDGGEAIYNTWFENRWMRAEEKAGGQGKTRAQSVVRATLFGDTIIIHCPTKLWAEQLATHMRTLRGLSPRRFAIAGPAGYQEKPFNRERLLADIETCERMAARPHSDMQKLGPKYWNSLARIGKTMLARHEQRNG